MSKHAVVIRHIHFEDLGTLAPVLLERGYACRYVDPAIDDLATIDAHAPDLLVVLGGPIGAFDEAAYPFLEAELALVKERLGGGRPLLGICLGAQLIARAMGARVYPMQTKEIGFGPLTLTEAGRESVLAHLGATPVLHWHGDQFDIPPGATRLASTAIGSNQAFELGHSVLGLQFHLEVDARHIERWLVGHACELGQAGIDPRTVRDDARRLRSVLADTATTVFDAWLDRIDQHARGAQP